MIKISIILTIFIGVDIFHTSLIGNEEWTSYKEKYGKQYKSSLEDQIRYNNYLENVKKIEQHNKLFEDGMESYKMGINKFSDMTHEEFKNGLNTNYGKNIKINRALKPKKLIVGDDFPEAIDWRTKGAVTPVKNGGSCGAYAYAVIGAMEGNRFISTNTLVPLSTQQLIDCSSKTNDGCTGSLPGAYNYIRDNGLTTAEKYPDTNSPGECKYEADPDSIKINGHILSVVQNEEAYKGFVSMFPAATSIDASTMQSYKSGVFYDTECRWDIDYLTHPVLVVGYGAENGTDFWIVKNSWGTEWGEEGYLRIARNRNNTCGIGIYTEYPF